jgi:hypothetical protein
LITSTMLYVARGMCARTAAIASFISGQQSSTSGSFWSFRSFHSRPCTRIETLSSALRCLRYFASCCTCVLVARSDESGHLRGCSQYLERYDYDAIVPI